MCSLYYFFKTVFRISIYFFSDYKRYAHLLLIILKYKPKVIVEIGVYKGIRASQFIEAALIFNKKIEYHGFDLFEGLDKKILDSEFSKKPFTQNKIKKNLIKYSNIYLYKGFTNITLPKFLKKNKKKADFIFIDGGHSIKTIKNDWLYCCKMMHKKSLVVFDDFYKKNSLNSKFGCNKIIDNLKNKYDTKILSLTDQITIDGKNAEVNMVLVKQR